MLAFSIKSKLYNSNKSELNQLILNIIILS